MYPDDMIGVLRSAQSVVVLSGAGVVEIKPQRTPLTDIADWFLAGKSAEVLPAVLERVSAGRD